MKNTRRIENGDKATAKAFENLLPVGRCNGCLTYFPADRWDEMTECPHCKTDNYLMDMPELAAAGDLLVVCKAIASESRAGLRWSANNITALNAVIAKAEGK